MEKIRVERLDHLGVLASVIKDLGLIDMIDRRLVPDAQERITPGEAVAGMILNGLGFANRPLSLTPQCFANKPLDLLFRQGSDAGMFNRFKLDRTLDETSTYGCALLFEELALSICAQEGIDLHFNHLDTTSFSLTGECVPDSDEHAIRITHGYSKDHRPDLKQAVLELMVSQDSGVSFVSQCWDGNTSSKSRSSLVSSIRPMSASVSMGNLTSHLSFLAPHVPSKGYPHWAPSRFRSWPRHSWEP